MARAIVREIGIGLGREVGPVEVKRRRLDVKTAVRHMHAKDSRRRGPAQRMLAKNILDHSKAFVGRQQPLDSLLTSSFAQKCMKNNRG